MHRARTRQVQGLTQHLCRRRGLLLTRGAASLSPIPGAAAPPAVSRLREDLLEVFNPKQEQSQPLPSLPRQAAGTGTATRPQPCKPPRNCRYDVNSTLHGASLFHSKRKNSTLNPLHMHKSHSQESILGTHSTPFSGS